MTKKNDNNEIVGLKIIDFGMTSRLFAEYYENNEDVFRFLGMILPIEFKKTSVYEVSMNEPFINGAIYEYESKDCN